MLMLLFVGAGVYNLTVTGCLNSVRQCFSEPRPPSLTTTNERTIAEDQDDDAEPNVTRPLIQDRGQSGKPLSKAANKIVELS